MPRRLVLTLVLLVCSPLAAQSIITGAGAPGGPHVKTFTNSVADRQFFAYPPSFYGGVSVAFGDVDGDSVPDLIVGTATGDGHVTVFSGVDLSVIRNFDVYGTGYTSGVHVAAGDVNADGYDDIITGTGTGAGPHVKVFDGKTGALILSFFAFAPDDFGGVTVASGDVNGDGRDDVIVANASGAGRINAYSNNFGSPDVINTAEPFGSMYTGGITVASADVNGDGHADILAATASSNAVVEIVDGVTFAVSDGFFPYGAAYTGGVRVAAGDVNGDSIPEIITGVASATTPTVKAFTLNSYTTPVQAFSAYPTTFASGIYVGGYSPKPSATITSSTNICGGPDATINITLTGRGPWKVKWSDGVTETVTSAQYQRSVSAAGNYTILNVADRNHVTGQSSGNANVRACPPSPTGFDAHATSTSSADLSWSAVPGADHYEVWRYDATLGHSKVGETAGTAFTESGLAASKTYLYYVRAVDPYGLASDNSLIDPATTIVFTDPVLTFVKAVHITELRSAAAAFRLACGRPAATYSGPAPAPGGLILAAHIDDTRQAINECRAAIGLPDLFFASPASPGTPIRAANILALRAAVQ